MLYKPPPSPQRYPHYHRVVVGVFKAEVGAGHAFKLHVRGEDKPVNYVILGVLDIGGVIRLIQKTAGGRFKVMGKLPALAGEHGIVQNAGRPKLGVLIGECVQPAGENLIKISAGNDIVALFVFRFYKLAQLLGLGDFALAVVIRFKVEIDEHELL